MELQEYLRRLPQMDRFLSHPLFASVGRDGRLKEAAACELERLRDLLRRDEITQAQQLYRIDDAAQMEEILVRRTLMRLQEMERHGLRRVINGTGVALHTNLGRAPLAKEAVEAVQVAAGYSNLEYDLETGARGSRGSHIEPLLCRQFGCEDALAVNNNAAAILLALRAAAKGGEVLLSRGELVEIGDGFRIPEILAESGAVLVEVGTTNRTHLRDYLDAVTPRTAAILKVHTSNFKVVGFTSEVSVRELAAAATEKGLPLIVDLGSGAALPAQEYPFDGEPSVQQALADGADIVCFSGDKLLGGPQAGILLGKKRWMEPMRRCPLTRALRLDKLSIAALAATLELYGREGAAKTSLPVLESVCASEETLLRRAKRLQELVYAKTDRYQAELVRRKRPVGGGSAPGQLLDGWAVSFQAEGISAVELEQALRQGSVPVIGYLADKRFFLDVATIREEELEETACQLAQIQPKKS